MAVLRKSSIGRTGPLESGRVDANVVEHALEFAQQIFLVDIFQMTGGGGRICGVAGAVRGCADGCYPVADFVASIVGEGMKINSRILVHAGRGLFVEAVKLDSVHGARDWSAARLAGNIKFSTN